MKKHILFLLILTGLNANAQEEKKDFVKFGGAFRYTYMKNSWNETHKKKGGQAIFDAAILNARGEIKGIEFATEVRYYAESFGGFMLRNGYVGLPLTDNLKLKLGMPRTPFGITPYTGNSFMFNMPYYLGFEDDSDIGVLLEYTKNDVEVQLNFDKNSEDIFSDKNRRYAYDISGKNEELNQITGRTAYHFGKDKKQEVGISAQYGQIYNTTTEQKGNKYAIAGHLILRKNRWDLKAQSIIYEFSPKDSIAKDYITMGAFAYDYNVAKKGVVSNVSISYKLPVNHKLLNDIKFYNDFSVLNKSVGNFEDSYMNVTGFMVHTGPIYMLVDYVIAQNHAWIGNNYTNALYSGNETKWHRRFNINLGIYF